MWCDAMRCNSAKHFNCGVIRSIVSFCSNCGIKRSIVSFCSLEVSKAGNIRILKTSVFFWWLKRVLDILYQFGSWGFPCHTPFDRDKGLCMSMQCVASSQLCVLASVRLGICAFWHLCVLALVRFGICASWHLCVVAGLGMSMLVDVEMRCVLIWQ